MTGFWDLWTHPLGQPLAWTLLHFAWQGTLVAALLALILTPMRQAQWRYALSLAALAVMAACPLLTLAVLTGRSTPATEVLWATTSPQIRSFSPPACVPQAISTDHSLAATSATAETPTLTPRRSWHSFVLAAWLLGVLVLSLRLLLSVVGLGLWRRGRQPLSAELAAPLADWAARLGLRRVPRVYLSARVRGAMALGLWRPLVLLPASWLATMPPNVFEAVLLHELAHIRRWDLWANLAQRLVETLLFYHPAVWWLSRRIRQEREKCCDELAVTISGRRKAYVSALEWVALQQPAPGPALVGMAIGGRKMLLLDRVRSLLGLPPVRPSGVTWPVGLLTLAAVTGFWLLPARLSSPSVAQTPAAQEESGIPDRALLLTPRKDGSLTFSVGVNSDAGLIGTVVLDPVEAPSDVSINILYSDEMAGDLTPSSASSTAGTQAQIGVGINSDEELHGTLVFDGEPNSRWKEVSEDELLHGAPSLHKSLANLRSQGYWKARCVRCDVNSDAELRGYLLVPGPQYVINRGLGVDYHPDDLTERELARCFGVIGIDNESPYDEVGLKQRAAAAQRWLISQGYLDAKVPITTYMPKTLQPRQEKVAVRVSFAFRPHQRYPVRIAWANQQETSSDEQPRIPGDAMRRVVQFDVEKASLSDVLRSLRVLLSEANLALETPANLQTSELVTLHDSNDMQSMLGVLLKPYGLTFEANDRAIVIRRCSPMTTVSYSLSKLAAEPVDTLGLIELLTSSVAPNTWRQAGGQGTWERKGDGELLITQTGEIHEELQQRLAQLRATRGKLRLDQPASFHFDQQPLGEVLQRLQERYQIAIWVDHAGLRETGCSLKTAVTIHVDQPLSQALSELLAPLKLDWEQTCGVLTVTSQSRCQILSICYAVSDLVNQEPGTGTFSWKDLQERIRNEVLPESWEERGGRAIVAPFETNLSLVVSQTPRGHRQLQMLLEQWRESSGQ